MDQLPSPRLRSLVDALPLEPGMRVLEIGCGPGAAARYVAELVGPHGFVLAIDRSERAVAQALGACAAQIATGRMQVRRAEIETFHLAPGELSYDLAFAARVGVLDGRYPDRAPQALRAIADALTPSGRLFIDGGDPVREVRLPRA